MVFRPFLRRPLLRGAMVAGAGYYAGRKMQQYGQNESDEQQRIAALEAQQMATAPPPSAPAPVGGESAVQQLTDLKKLLDQGALTQAEFDSEKARILRR